MSKKIFDVNDHFSKAPLHFGTPRSKFNRPFDHKTSWDIGKLYPIYWTEVLPGDGFRLKTSKLVRASSPLDQPFFGNLYLDTYYFFVPQRLLWKHSQEFFGEDTTSAWVNPPTYTVPQTTAPAGGWNNGSLADYMGIPTKVGNLSVSSLPFRAVAKIWNDWFRDENLDDEIVMSDGDATTVGTNNTDYIQYLETGACVPPVSKFRDYFVSSLPKAQKGPAVTVPALDSLGNVPVFPMGQMTLGDSVMPEPLKVAGLKYVSASGDTPAHFEFIKGGLDPNKIYERYESGSNSSAQHGAIDYWTSTDTYNDRTIQSGTSSNSVYMMPSNLWADMSNVQMVGATINQLRLAFQLQKLLERNALGGTRYIELIRSHFGIVSPDSRLQRSEFLSGSRADIDIQAVTQMAPGTDSKIGTQGAYSITGDSQFDFSQSFTEHGFIVGFCCIRYKHTYQQGLNRAWSRKGRYDYYWPALANIGNMAVLNKELYAQGSDVKNETTGESYDDEVFGYQEAWSEYRYHPSQTSGVLRSNDDQSLDVWHLADNYASMPYLSADWLHEDGALFDRVCTLQLYGTNSQFIADIHVDEQATRCMPMYSIPGLIDHN